jgi:hypothetical protein
VKCKNNIEGRAISSATEGAPQKVMVNLNGSLQRSMGISTLYIGDWHGQDGSRQDCAGGVSATQISIECVSL